MEGEHNNNIVPPHQIVLLSPESQLLLSIIDKKSELPSYVDGTINEAVNDMAVEFLAKVKKSVVDILFMSNSRRGQRQNRERGLTKTIMDKDWHKTEKQIEKAIRFFPDVVVEKYRGYYPIQWMALRNGNNATKSHSLMSISLIPLIIKLAIEFQSFDEHERGGVLSLYPSGNYNTLQIIICYPTNKNNEDNKLLDDCFSTVRNWMRGNYLVTEDIQQYNLFGKLIATGIGFVSQSRLRYLLDMDPVPLSLPCFPEYGNFLPIHWSVNNNKDIQTFSFLWNAGMQHYPEQFGFIFRMGTNRYDNGKSFRGTPYQPACKKYGQGTVLSLVMDRIQDYISSTSTSAAANNREISLLMSAITDKLIHRDALYILLRKDPIAALEKIQQRVLRVVGDDGQKGSTDTITNTHSNTNDNISKGATDTIAAAAAVSASMTTTAAPTTTTIVSSPPTATTPTSRDSLAIIPFQATMVPTVSTSSNNDSDNTTIPSDSNDTLPDE